MENLGRNGDTELGHLAHGELVIPVELQTATLLAELRELFTKAGADINRYIVGNKDNSINPSTGYSEYFFQALLAAAPAVLGAMGSGKSKSSQGQSKTGYEALPSFVQEYLKDNQFDRIKEYGAGEYQGMPTRTFGRDDYDPTFGSQRRIEYGDQKISQVLDRLRNPQEEAPEAVAESDLQSDFLASLMATVNRQNPRGQALGGGRFTGDIAEGIKRGGGDISGALESYGFTPDNYRTQNLSPHAIGAILNAARGEQTGV